MGVIIQKSKWRRDEFDVQCFRCDCYVSIFNAMFIEKFKNRFVAFLFRYPVRYMCHECIVEVANYIMKDFKDKW